jgi:hypothetical protein
MRDSMANTSIHFIAPENWGLSQFPVAEIKVATENVSLPPESGSHNEMHNLVCGRISDEKDKGAVYAGI